MKVIIPEKVEDALKLATKVYAKHKSDGDNSELKHQPWDIVGPTIEKALKLHEDAEELKKNMLTAYEQRDKLLAPIGATLKGSRDVLSGNHKSEMKILGDWGYEVVETSKISKKKVN